MFKIMIVQQLYNLGADQMEYQLNDSLAFVILPASQWQQSSGCQDNKVCDVIFSAMVNEPLTWFQKITTNIEPLWGSEK